MGGHAFKGLYCPRISPAVYEKVKAETKALLQTVFAQVVVPTEMPGKDDFGDVDFLVCSPLHFKGTTTIDTFPWQSTVSLIKDVLDTTHGRQGYLTPDCMYFAIDSPHGEENYFIQIDVKVCFKPELFHWCHFELNYASNSKMIGSMVKPLGLTMDPEGVHVRVEEMEETNFPGSMVWVSKDPKDALRIVGLDWRILDGGFGTKEEIYTYLASSWLFHPGHFAARLAEEKYNDRLEDRAPYWTHFIKEWVPQHYPGYHHVRHGPENGQDNGRSGEDIDETLPAWQTRTRTAVRNKVFTMFPHIASEYYTKRAAWVKEREEQRLRELITQAIPTGQNGWSSDVPVPTIIVKYFQPQTPDLEPTTTGEMTPPLTPPLTPSLPFDASPTSPTTLVPPLISPSPSTSSPNPPLTVSSLPLTPPLPFTPSPPPPNMSASAKLLCLFRWTHFDASTGTPFLASVPRDKDFTMAWTDAQYAGATDGVLVRWAEEVWWSVWVRQCVVNYRGMWRRRFEKAGRKGAVEGGMGGVEEKAGVEGKEKGGASVVGERVEKVRGRLSRLNESLVGLV
ncbi:hypothetical protein J4E93_010628 [Alternaria ventricosa]|uniref:uncharacterized protein n=1 Tax=Alternaria ventricosa TaxID=1187951 RepID=UPI0020C1D9EA|nr:uncharacterized protein J4E93_010628 [Alternaria ventricosa]KAI4637112.1 hypothetical protein J4E93_010628 [Alternaria ventricosa]